MACRHEFTRGGRVFRDYYQFEDGALVSSVVPACAYPYSLGVDVQHQANFDCLRARQRGTPCPIEALQVQDAANLVCLRTRQRGASVVSQVEDAANLAGLRARQ